jgi:hypothetical protein
MKDTANPAPRKVATIFDARVARRLAALLEDELIPAEVLSDSSQRWYVLVPSDYADRACVILRSSELSEAELSYLAVGELGSDHGSG